MYGVKIIAATLRASRLCKVHGLRMTVVPLPVVPAYVPGLGECNTTTVTSITTKICLELNTIP